MVINSVFLILSSASSNLFPNCVVWFNNVSLKHEIARVFICHFRELFYFLYSTNMNIVFSEVLKGKLKTNETEIL